MIFKLDIVLCLGFLFSNRLFLMIYLLFIKLFIASMYYMFTVFFASFLTEQIASNFFVVFCIWIYELYIIWGGIFIHTHNIVYIFPASNFLTIQIVLSLMFKTKSFVRLSLKSFITFLHRAIDIYIYISYVSYIYIWYP